MQFIREQLLTWYEQVSNKVTQAKKKYSCSTLEYLKVSDVRSPLVHPFPIGKYDCPHPFPLFLSKLPHVELIKMLRPPSTRKPESWRQTAAGRVNKNMAIANRGFELSPWRYLDTRSQWGYSMRMRWLQTERLYWLERGTETRPIPNRAQFGSWRPPNALAGGVHFTRKFNKWKSTQN